MKKIIFILAISMFGYLPGIDAQGLQPGECGIMFTYDATGCLVQREFICNNTGTVMYRKAFVKEMDNDSIAISDVNKVTKNEIVKASTITPNPTSGKFTIQLGKPLNNENVLLMDINGKVIQSKKRSGSTLAFDISNFSSGIYFVKIEGNGTAITLKVIRQ